MEADRVPPDWGFPVEPGEVSMAALEIAERNRFLDLLMEGRKPLPAGLSLGWSVLKCRQIEADPMMAELIQVIEQVKDDNVESSIYNMTRHNFQAAQWWLLNRRGEKWKDTKRVVVDHTERVSIEVVHSVRHAALELLREQGVAALQPGGGLDAIEARVVE